MYVRVDMNIINLINEKYKGNISLQEHLNCVDNFPKELMAILGHSSWRTEQEILPLNYCRGLQKGWIWF